MLSSQAAAAAAYEHVALHKNIILCVKQKKTLKV